MENAIFTPLSLQNLLNLIQEEIQNAVNQSASAHETQLIRIPS
jgi:hypothetical protein